MSEDFLKTKGLYTKLGCGLVFYVPYSIISKIESIHEESHVILSKLTNREIGKFPGAYGTTKFDNNEYLNKLRELYSNVPREIMDKIYEKYEIDFDLFNYEKI